MDFQNLKKAVYKANMSLVKYNLVIHTWGNVSGLSDDGKYFAIKPSGVSYNQLKWEDIVVLDLNGKVIEGAFNPSSDTPTHLWLYNHLDNIKGIVHTHAPYSVSWASTGFSIPCYSTTHADNFYDAVFCTRELNQSEIDHDYELNTGKVITSELKKHNVDPKATPAVLVKSHGPFAWSYKSPQDAVDLALTLEEVAKIAFFTKTLNPNQLPASSALQNKHYFRKHGANAYYGQNKS